VKVPFLDVAAAYTELQSEIESAILTSTRTGQYIGGHEVEAFEQQFADYVSANCCVSVASGLDAIHLALRGMGVGPGDEVIVPANTFVGTWLAVSHCGASPVPVDPLEDTFNLDPQAIEAAISDRTRVILPVHLFGQPADLDPIVQIAERRGLLVLEDAAQAHGARYKDVPVGARGDAVAWSFYPAKNLGALGDGGAVTSNDQDLCSRIRALGNYGARTKYVVDLMGFNSRMDPLQAAVLRVKLRHLEEWNTRRKNIAQRYDEALQGLGLLRPAVPGWADPVWHQYVVRHPRRDELKQQLESAGVETLIHYPLPPHMQSVYESLGYDPHDFPVARRLADQMLSLPVGPHMIEEQVETVIRAVRSADLLAS